MLEEIQTVADPADLVRRYFARVYRFVSAATGAPPEDVEDIVQETLYVTWRDRSRFRGGSSVITWILGIAKNRVRQYRREQKRKPRTGALLDALERLESDDLPPEILHSHELGRRIRRALQDLEEEYSRVLIQRYLHGKTVREVARKLGESEKAVESRLHRAREAMRELLWKGDDDE